MKNALHWIKISIFVAIIFADSIGLVPILQTVLLVPFIWMVLRLRDERWSEIGLSLPSGLLKLVVPGALAGILMELFAVHVATPG